MLCSLRIGTKGAHVLEPVTGVRKGSPGLPGEPEHGGRVDPATLEYVYVFRSAT